MAAGGDLADIAAVPQYPAELKKDYLVDTGASRDGAFQAAQRAATPLIRIRLSYKNQTDVEIASLKAFVEDNSGLLSGFTYTYPVDSVEYNVRFEEEPSFTKHQINNHSADVRLVTRPA